jgi:serine phosphatase RsbU (regulator of sigma subunit)
VNPLKKFKHYITGDALATTDDAFKKSKINLTFNYTFCLIILGLVFYGNIIANGYWWQFYITTFGVLMPPFVLVVLKKTGDIRKAGLVLIANQVCMSALNLWLYKFDLNIIGGFWSMVQIIFVFFVMGSRWGFIVTIYTVMLMAIGIADVMMNHTLLTYHIPPEQVPKQELVFVLVPMSICVYGIYQVVRTRDAAEKQIQEQKLQLEEVNREITAQKQDIVSSINYAQRIQSAVLPHIESIQKNIPQFFLLYKPKDIVSGDFYWFHEIDGNNYLLVCADCTGHGVPGAFMTVIGSTLLNQVVMEKGVTEPEKILLGVDDLLNITLKQNNEKFLGVQDGMDLSLIRVNKSARELVFTSAKRPVVFIGDNQVREHKGSKFSLGGMRSGDKQFEEIKINYKAGDSIYFFSDGYHDQFGGEKGKKFSSKRLKELLFQIHQKPISEQKNILDKEFENWKGGREQVDDVCVIGIRF